MKKKIETKKKFTNFQTKYGKTLKISTAIQRTMQRKHLNLNQISGRNYPSAHTKPSSFKNNYFLSNHCWRLYNKVKKTSENNDESNGKLYHLHCHTTNGICHQVMEINICSGPPKNCAFAWKRKLRQYRISNVIFESDENEEIILPTTEREFSVKSQRFSSENFNLSSSVNNNNFITLQEGVLANYNCEEEKLLNFDSLQPAETEFTFVCLDVGEGGKFDCII